MSPSIAPFSDMNEENTENDQTEDDEKDLTSLSVSMETDRDKFFRRTCPSCGLDFKTDVNENDFAWLLADQVKRQGKELGISAETPSEENKVELYCPYCQTIFESNESFTEDTINYAKRIVYRDVVQPMIDKIFGGMADRLNRGNRSSGGFISISISMEHNRQIKPPRPVSGPEPSDMKIVDFLCCNKKAKILEGWDSMHRCIYCQTEIVIV